MLMSYETFQCTEEDHCDREDLLNAVNIMSNIAAFINESKRRKDIVDKYLLPVRDMQYTYLVC